MMIPPAMSFEECVNSFSNMVDNSLSDMADLSKSLQSPQSYDLSTSSFASAVSELPAILRSSSLLSHSTLVSISTTGFDDLYKSTPKNDVDELRWIYRTILDQNDGQITLGLVLQLLREVLLEYSPTYTGRNLETTALAAYLGFDLPDIAYRSEDTIIGEEDFILVMATTKNQAMAKREKQKKAKKKVAKKSKELYKLKEEKEAESKEEVEINQTFPRLDLHFEKEDKEEMESKKGGETFPQLDLYKGKEDKDAERKDGEETCPQLDQYLRKFDKEVECKEDVGSKQGGEAFPRLDVHSEKDNIEVESMHKEAECKLEGESKEGGEASSQLDVYLGEEDKETECKEEGVEKRPARDPNAPKLNMSASMIYDNAMMEDFKTKNPGVSFDEYTVFVSNGRLPPMYKELHPTQQAVWISLAESDKARYLREIELYNPSDGYDRNGDLIVSSTKSERRGMSKVDEKQGEEASIRHALDEDKNEDYKEEVESKQGEETSFLSNTNLSWDDMYSVSTKGYDAAESKRSLKMLKIRFMHAMANRK